MPKKKQYRCLCLLLYAVLCLDLVKPQTVVSGEEHVAEKNRYEVSRRLMGVKFRFVVYADSLAMAEKGLLAAIHRVSEIEGMLTDYDPDSELMTLCRNAKVDVPVKVSDDVFNVLAASENVNLFSEGAFDPTIGVLSKLWRQARKTKTIPEKDDITRAVQRTGWSYVNLDRDKQSIAFKKVGVLMDLGGIAKGYAADEAIKTLRTNGINQALVDASGDVTVSNAPPGKKGWKVAIGDSVSNSFVTLCNASIATSGDRFQFLEVDGKKYSHIINPKTGMGTTHQNLVTVVCRSTVMPGTLADAYASAFSVMNRRLIDQKINATKLVSDESVYIRIKTKTSADAKVSSIESMNFAELAELK